MNRAEILQAAEKCVCEDRQEQYGEPGDTFKAISLLLNAYKVSRKNGGIFNAHDAAIMMALVKIGRIATGQFKEDNYIDAAGYLAIAGELAGEGD